MKTKWQLFGNWRTITVFAVVFICGYWMSLDLVHHHDEAVASDAVKAPALTIKRLTGEDVALTEYAGKWVFLNFWATWCPPCIQEMPSLESFYQLHKEKNMRVLAISVDSGETQRIRDFVEKKKFSFEFFHDPTMKSLKLFGANQLPVTFIIDPEGNVVAHAMGARDWMDPEVLAYFQELMGPKKEGL